MKNSYIYIILVVAIIGGLVLLRGNSSVEKPQDVSQYDDFAQCIADTGAVFYGAYWCPHCQDQKEMFEQSKNLPYVECSTANGQGQTKICADENITGYPTWKFADGSSIDGLLSFDDLSEKTGCDLP